MDYPFKIATGIDDSSEELWAIKPEADFQFGPKVRIKSDGEWVGPDVPLASLPNLQQMLKFNPYWDFVKNQDMLDEIFGRKKWDEL